MDGKRKNFREEVLRFVASFFRDNGYPPTYDEIKDSVGLSSKSHVDYYLSILEKEGLIERKPRTPRGLRLVGTKPNHFEVNVEGTIAAGSPVQAVSEPGKQLELTSDIADPRKEIFALQVRGESMVEALVGEGDFLICERAHQVRPGQMAVVHLADRNEATLKRVYLEGRQVRLQPAHPFMKPIYADARHVQIQGRVVAVLRRF